MNTIAFTNKLKELGLTKVYPNNLPSQKDLVTGVFFYTSTAEDYITSGTINYQFLTVGKDLNSCENTSNDIINWLLTNPLEFVIIDDFKIYGLSMLQLAPIYLGIDNEKRYQFGFNVEITVKKFKVTKSIESSSDNLDINDKSIVQVSLSNSDNLDMNDSSVIE